METQVYASFKLRADVIDRGLCPLCGGCGSGCPYLGQYGGHIVQLDCCTLTEGSCYRNCPRTRTDLDALSRSVFGEPFSADDIGIVKGAFLARATETEVKTLAGGGGVAAALLRSALQGATIDAVPCSAAPGETPQGLLSRNLATSTGRAVSPVPTLLTNPAEVTKHITTPHRTARVLAAFNSIPKESTAKLGMVCLPCQVASMRKRLGNPTDGRTNVQNVRLLISEFCATKRWLEPGEDRQSANKACSYCWDLTGELADISVGSGRGQYQDWNTVFVRTTAGKHAFDAACQSGAIESKPLPAENLAQEKKASREKKGRAVRNLSAMTGSKADLAYLVMPPKMMDALRGDS